MALAFEDRVANSIDLRHHENWRPISNKINVRI